MNNLLIFNLESDFNEKKNELKSTNVSFTKDSDKLWVTKNVNDEMTTIEIPNDEIWLIYETFNENEEIKLFHYNKGTSISNGNNVTAITIDDNKIEIDGVNSTYYHTFPTIGKHKVIVHSTDEFKKIPEDSFYYCENLTSVEIPSSVTSIGSNAFDGCTSLTEITCLATTAPNINSMGTFCDIAQNGVLKVPFGSDYSSWMSTSEYYLGYYNWTIETLYEPQECTNLVITAENVIGNAISTTISYTATTNGINTYTNEQMSRIEVTGTAISNQFEQNTDRENTVVRTITFEYMGVTAETTITQGVWIDQSYSINLNNQWQLSSSYDNFDSETYDGIYESFSNYNVNSSSATCIVTIVGYTNFTLYIGSYGESSYDYTIAFDIDGTSTEKVTTKSFQRSPTSIDSFKKVEYTDLDSGQHTITIVYRKDGGYNHNDDKGYLLIPKEQ